MQKPLKTKPSLCQTIYAILKKWKPNENMNNWIGLCFLKSHGIFPFCDTPWGLCYWKHCQLKLFHFQELPQEWEWIYCCCHMPCSELSTHLLAATHFGTCEGPRGHPSQPKEHQQHQKQGKSQLFSGVCWWGAVWEGSSSSPGAEAGLVCVLGSSTQTPGAGAPHKDFKIQTQPFCENKAQKYELYLPPICLLSTQHTATQQQRLR